MRYNLTLKVSSYAILKFLSTKGITKWTLYWRHEMDKWEEEFKAYIFFYITLSLDIGNEWPSVIVSVEV